MINYDGDNTSSSEDVSDCEISSEDAFDFELSFPQLSDYNPQNKMNDMEANSDEIKMINNCAYYTDTTFNDSVKLHNKLSVLHFNSQSLNKKIDNIKDYLSQFTSPFNIIAVSETWMSDNKGTDLTMTGYEMFYTNRKDKRSGGVALYIDRKLDCKSIENMSLAVEGVLECVTVEITLEKRNKILVSCVYRTSGSDISVFKDWIEKLFSLSTKHDIILCGDYNIDLLKVNNEKSIKDFIDSMLSNNLYPLITRPTRVTVRSTTLIDNIFTNIINNEIISGILVSDISDHFPVFMVYNVNCKTSKENNYSYSRIKTEQTLTDLKNDLAHYNWDFIYDELDINIAYNSFLEVFITLYYKHCPKRKLRKKNDSSVPWMTKGLLNACKKKNNLYKKLIKNRTSEAELKYKKYKNKLTSILREAKKDYYAELLNSKRNDIQGIWNTLNNVMGRGFCGSTYPEYFEENGKVIANKNEIVERFNSFFVSIGPELAKKIPTDNNPVRNLIETNSNSMFLSPTDENEVLETIRKFKNKTSQDIDDIDMKTVKYVAEAIARPFAHICNLSFQYGQFPSKMKIARVIPLYKSGDKHCFSNYRPVSLLPQFSKILEKLFNSRLQKFVEKNNLLSDCQYGFRQGRSTSLALIDLVEEITKCIERKKHVIGLFIDLQKAFDTIDHEILVNKMEKYGIRGLSQNWIQSYLEDRQQFVHINQHKSSFKNILCGVPQGSILGPTLFSLYINDISKISNQIKFILFADDTNILCSGEDLQKLILDITHEMQTLMNWFNVNKLSLNLKKTKLMCFGYQKIDIPVHIMINNTNIERVQQNVFLGVIIDEKLSWKPHINYLCSKVAKCVGVMKRCSLVLNQKSLLILYNSFIMAYLNYCLEVWGNCYKTNLLALIVLQKRAIRIAHKVKYKDHTRPLFLMSFSLRLDDMVNYKIVQIMYKASKKILPDNIQCLFHDRDAHHSYNLRGTNQFYQAYARTNLKSRSTSERGITLWNKLSEEIKNSKSLTHFKIMFKQHVMLKYQKESND